MDETTKRAKWGENKGITLQPKTDEETYPATLAARIFRLLIALTAYFNWYAFQFDALSAFTNARTPEEQGLDSISTWHENSRVCSSTAPRYGLRISPLLWFELLSQTMRKLGLKHVPECACLLTNDKLIVFFYVDDIVVLFHPSNRQSYEAFRTAIMSHFQLREIG